MTKIDSGLMPLGDILKQAIPRPIRTQVEQAAKTLKPLSRVQKRLLEPAPEHELEICFQHSVLCQTGLPYKEPKTREWERRQGNALLRIEAGAVPNPASGKYENVSLPWGPKPRLILAHLNTEALRFNSPEIDVEKSLSGFVKRIRGFATGREIRAFKYQLACLSSATIRMAMFHGEQARGINTHIITSFELWLHKNERQRALWPSTVCLSEEYFRSLQEHAVPLNDIDLAALAHTAMGLDVYAWLAQRLHRINPAKPAFIPWAALKDQFGPDYDRMDNFKRFFRRTLAQVCRRYHTARVALDGHGMTASNSPPPVPKRLIALPPKP